MNSFYAIDCFNFVLTAAAVILYRGSNNFSDDLSDLVYKMISTLKRTNPGGKWYAVWDAAGGTHFRKNIDKNYKADRDNSRIDFEAVLACKKLFEIWGMENLSLEKTEADDTIAVLCKELREKYPDAEITIFSRDKDLLQIVQNGWANRQYDFSKKKDLEVPEYSVVDFKALAGDPSDNIKGLPGVGEKTAIKIIQGQRVLTEEEKVLFEKYKSMVDTRLHPLFEKNCETVKKLIN